MMKISRRAFLKLSSCLCATGLSYSASYELTQTDAREAITVSAKKGDLPPPIVISGLETYGHETPLNQAQLDALIVEFNEEFERRSAEGETVRLPGTHHMTELVWDQAYWQIPAWTGDQDYQTFINRHTQALSQVLINANPLLTGGLVTRRVMRVAEGVEAPVSCFLDWLENGIRDCNGDEGLWFLEPYNPTQSAYYHEDEKVDWGRNHELAHKGLRITDIYLLSGHFVSAGITSLSLESLELLLYEASFSRWRMPWLTEEKIEMLKEDLVQRSSGKKTPKAASLPPSLEGIPPEWHQYDLGWRRDGRGKGLMIACDAELSSLGAWILARRAAQGWLHDDQKTIPEYLGDFPNEVRPVNVLAFGEEFKDARVRIWRSNGDYSHRNLEDLILEGEIGANGEVEIGNPFEGVNLLYGKISAYQAVLFVRVAKPNGEEWWRYLDVGDFLIGLGLANYPFGLKLHLELANEDISPDELDWTIEYGKIERPYEVNLPLVVG